MKIYGIDRIDIQKFNNIKNEPIFNKPVGGLWGCREDEWYHWCIDENFQTNKLVSSVEVNIDNLNILKIDSSLKAKEVIKSYPLVTIWKTDDSFMGPFLSIDYEKISKIYDAIEVTQDVIGLSESFSAKDLINPTITDVNGNRLNEQLDEGQILCCKFNTWDVPSICILRKEALENISLLKNKVTIK